MPFGEPGFHHFSGQNDLVRMLPMEREIVIPRRSANQMVCKRVTSGCPRYRSSRVWSVKLTRRTQDLEWVLQMPSVLQALGADCHSHRQSITATDRVSETECHSHRQSLGRFVPFNQTLPHFSVYGKTTLFFWGVSELSDFKEQPFGNYSSRSKKSMMDRFFWCELIKNLGEQ